MIEGSCHCGKATWQKTDDTKAATVCNCTICRRYGVIWAYGFVDEGIAVHGRTVPYIWGDREIAFHFCPQCGCVMFWRGVDPGPDGRTRIAVNLRMADPGAVGGIPIRHFDGYHSWTDSPDDGRCVRDYLS